MFLSKVTEELGRRLQTAVCQYDKFGSISDLQTIDQCLNDGAYIDVVNYNSKVYGWSPLMTAVNNDANIQLTKLLALRGANLNTKYPSKDAEGYPILSWSIENDNYKTAVFLINYGANVNNGSEDKTPLFVAVRKKNLEIVELLLDNGAICTGHTALLETIDSGSFEILEKLLDRGVDVNFEYKGYTPLIRAVKRSDAGMVQKLLKKGANVNLSNAAGQLPINMSIENGNFDVVKLLVEAGARLNMEDNNRDSLLFKALRRANFKIVKCLVEAGAEVNQNNKDNPLVIAASNLDFLSFQLLIEVGVDINPVLDKLEEVARNNKNFDICLKAAMLKRNRKTTASYEAGDGNQDASD